MKIRYKTKIAIIGAGQAGLSAGYHLKKMGWEVGPDFIMLDGVHQACSAWQSRWDSLTLSTVNRIHDLPGMAFEETNENNGTDVQANSAVPHYFDLYEMKFGLQVYRPVKVEKVYLEENRFFIDTSSTAFSALGIINATGTWESPYIPEYPGAALLQPISKESMSSLWEGYISDSIAGSDFKSNGYGLGHMQTAGIS